MTLSNFVVWFVTSLFVAIALIRVAIIICYFILLGFLSGLIVFKAVSQLIFKVTFFNRAHTVKKQQVSPPDNKTLQFALK